MEKNKINGMIRVAAFIVIFVVLLEAVSLHFFSEDVATRYSNRMKDAYSFTNEKSGSLQIISVGNSDLYSGITPLELWRRHGWTSSVCASPNQTLQDSIAIMKTVFQTHKPKIVIIETDMFYDHGLRKKRKVKNSDKMAYYFDKWDPEFVDAAMQSMFPIFKFHNYWKGGKTRKNMPFNLHGYKYNEKVRPLKKYNYMKPTDKLDPIKRITEEQVDRLIALCKENGADVLLMELPSINSWNYERHNAVQSFADKRGLRFLDMNMDLDDIGINWKNCFRDISGSHLNYRGAVAATRYLGIYLANHYALEDRRGNKEYANWNDDIEKFDRYRMINRSGKTQRTDEFIQ